VVFLTICFAQPTAANAVTVIGAGAKTTCGKWLCERQSGGFTISNWVLGFLSGVGTLAPDLDPLNRLDSDAVLHWIDNYCRAHPLDPITNALKAFVKEHPR
jgi:hypothetical protein